MTQDTETSEAERSIQESLREISELIRDRAEVVAAMKVVAAPYEETIQALQGQLQELLGPQTEQLEELNRQITAKGEALKDPLRLRAGFRPHTFNVPGLKAVVNKASTFRGVVSISRALELEPLAPLRDLVADTDAKKSVAQWLGELIYARVQLGTLPSEAADLTEEMASRAAAVSFIGVEDEADGG